MPTLCRSFPSAANRKEYVYQRSPLPTRKVAINSDSLSPRRVATDILSRGGEKARAEATIPNATASGRIGIVPLFSASSHCPPIIFSFDLSSRFPFLSLGSLSLSLSTRGYAPLDLFRCVNLPSDLKEPLRVLSSFLSAESRLLS